jgi:excisionase family DNA binding protein
MEELFTVREVADKLKISVSSVYRYAEFGLIPHKKIGSSLRFTQENIETFIAGKTANHQRQNTETRFLNDDWHNYGVY